MLNELMNHPTKGLALLWVAFADLASRIPQINPENNKCLWKPSNATKGIMNPKIATLSSNQGWNNEKHKFNMPKWKDKAQLTNESFYQQFCFALGGFCRFPK